MFAKLLDYSAAPPRRRTKGSDSALRLVAIAASLAALAGAQVVISGFTEGYCLVWPSIGTHFAPGFTFSGFARVKPGMTKPEVLKLLGRPLTEGYLPAPSGWAQWQPGDQTWCYSCDSSARGGDWAWLSREVVFRDGVVVQKVSWTYRD